MQILHYGLALWKLLYYNIVMEKKYANKYLMETGIGLQDVDHLKNSNYFLSESQKYIKGEITLDELERTIESYYKNKPDIEDRSKEADEVSIRITRILQNDSFTFSIGQLQSIHKELFEGLLDHPGLLRTYNFTKKEWVLDGDTVIYGDFRELSSTLQFDFSYEKSFDYSKMNMDETIEHIAVFVSNLWQIHVFEEGNTRTTAVFLIKYLRKLGFDVSNDTFSKNAWYFRNALVRANYSNFPKGIYEDKSYLVKFLRNLLLGEDNKLQNRDLHISTSNKTNIVKLKPNQKMILDLLKNNKNITSEQIADALGLSVRTVKNVINAMKNMEIIERVGGKRYGYWKVNND